MRRRISFIHILFLLIFSFGRGESVFAQLSNEDKLDSLRAGFTRDSARIYRHKEVSLLLAIDKRNTFIQTSSKIAVEAVGGQIGMVIDERHNLGLGFYSITNTTQQVAAEKKTQTVNLKMGYATLFYEYTFVDTRFWEIGFPLEIGGGSYQTLVTDSAGKRIPEFKDTLKRSILLLGGGLNVDFKFFKWVGINAMVGYRVVGGNEPNKVNFNGFFYSVGMHWYLGELMRMFKIHEKRGAYRHNVSMINNPPPWD